MTDSMNATTRRRASSLPTSPIPRHASHSLCSLPHGNDGLPFPSVHGPSFAHCQSA